jgi:hypothetical protein
VPEIAVVLNFDKFEKKMQLFGSLYILLVFIECVFGGPAPKSLGNPNQVGYPI